MTSSRTRVPGITEELADQVARIVRSLRTLELKKYPSVSETLDWARTLVVLGVESIDAEQARDTLHILLKYRSDIERAAKELACPDSAGPAVGAERHARRSLSGFVGELRAAGLPVSLTEHLDAAEAVHHIPLEDRDALKYALAATPREVVVALEGVRDRLRDLLLACAAPSTPSSDEQRRPRPTRTTSDSSGDSGRQGKRPRRREAAARRITPEELAEMLYRALLAANDAQVAARGPPGGDPLRRHGAGPAGGWARTTSTGRCGTSTSTRCSSA